MRKLFIILVVLIVAAGCRGPEIVNHQCETNISNYKSFKYEFLEKDYVYILSGDSIFSAVIKITRNQDTVLMDSIYCYCLAICNVESLNNATFFNENNDTITSIHIEARDKEWKKNLTSDNLEIHGFRSIAPLYGGKWIERRLYIKK